jgi:hypothetical protein
MYPFIACSLFVQKSSGFLGHTDRKRKKEKSYFTENYKFKFQKDLNCHGPRPLINDRPLDNPPPFSLYTTFDVLYCYYCMVNCGFALLPSSGSSQPCVHSQCASRKVSTSPCAHPISRSFFTTFRGMSHLSDRKSVLFKTVSYFLKKRKTAQ